VQPIFGRDRDIAEVRALVSQHPLVTITGVGGIGKTRLAQSAAVAIAHDANAPFVDGAWWVELAPIVDGALVASAAARAIGVTLASGRPAHEALAEALSLQKALLVLDNCERVADDVAALVEAVLASAPGINILVTSQEVLKAGAEHVYRLGPLADAALDLLVDRVRAVSPQFTLGDDDARNAAHEICRRLDGIPLAIELAAARVPLLGLDGVRARLDERFSLLTAGARIALRRHQTLRATLEWSHGLLDTDEQAVFRRLGVFAGGFALEAAQSVASDSHIDGWTAIDHLGALVDKSLVLVEGEATPRYRMLETTRAYALERLGESGETESTLRRHAEAMLHFGLVFDAQRTRWAATPASAREIGAELDNVRAAMEWCAKSPAGRDLALPLAGASHRIWWAAGLLREGLDRCLAVRDEAGRAASKQDAARYWMTVAQLGQYATRREAYEAALNAARLLRELGARDLLHEVLACAAFLAQRFGSAEDMRAQIDEAASLQHEGMAPRQFGTLELSRFAYHMRLGRFEDALACARRQVEHARAGGQPSAPYIATTQVVTALLELGRLDDAVAVGQEAIARLCEIGSDNIAGHLYVHMASALLLQGRVDEGADLLERAYTRLVREGDEQRVVMPLAAVCAKRGRVEDAARILGYEDAHDDGMRVDGRHRVFALHSRLEQAIAALPRAGELRALGAVMTASEVFALGFRR
jgi:predicted ATPase